jgi:two-component system response regulator
MMEEYNKNLDRFVGQKIKERRKSLGMTQADLAEMLGLSHQQVQRYETGESTLAVSRAIEIATILNVKMNYFYDDAPLARELSDKAAAGLIVKKPLKPLKMLLVEDSEHDELLFRKAVEKSSVDAEVQAILNPEKVMEFLESYPIKYGAPHPDIILLDINMPRVNGLTLLKKIKALDMLKSVPVIMLTNSVRSKDMLDAYASHANGFIQKNSDLAQFYQDVHQLLYYWSRTVILPSAA